MQRNNFVHPLAAKVEHRAHLIAGKNRLFAAALDLDKFLGLGHHDIEVDRRALVFDIVEIKYRGAFVNAGRNGRHQLANRKILELALIHQLVERDRHRDTTTSDRCRARAAVGLQDIAVDPDRALADLFQVDHCAQRAADEALDL